MNQWSLKTQENPSLTSKLDVHPVFIFWTLHLLVLML